MKRREINIISSRWCDIVIWDCREEDRFPLPREWHKKGGNDRMGAGRTTEGKTPPPP